MFLLLSIVNSLGMLPRFGLNISSSEGIPTYVFVNWLPWKPALRQSYIQKDWGRHSLEMGHKATWKAGMNTGRRCHRKVACKLLWVSEQVLLGWPIRLALNGSEKTRSYATIRPQWENLSLVLFLGPEPCQLQHSCPENICRKQEWLQSSGLLLQSPH